MTLLQKEEQRIKDVLNVFLVLFLAFGAILGGGVALFYRAELNTYVSDLKKGELYSIELQNQTISYEFDAVVSDLLFLTRQNELYDLLDMGNEAAVQSIEMEYVAFGATKRIYDQIRFLDSDGMELVRVNYNNGDPKAVSKEYLQNKGNRYYFTDCFSIQKNEIFVSPLDLNIEHAQVETPYKPMIRFGTPVFDHYGKKRGIVLLNYLASHLLERIKNSGGVSMNGNMLLNSEGYWLLSPDKTKEWGFMFKDRIKDSFAVAYPDEWQTIVKEGNGQIQTKNGLFTFRIVSPLQEGYRSSTGSTDPYSPSAKTLAPKDYFWALVSFIPAEAMDEYAYPLLVKIFILGAGLFVVIAFGAWHLALAITRRRIYQAQLLTMAMYDPLTELPNRKLFFDRLDAGIELAARHKRTLGLLYIDLDGFKGVNDTLGHEAGDELLIQVSKRLLACSRKSDTVARLGGDEFAVLLLEVHDAQGSKTAGDKIVETLCKPFILKAGEITIGACIGTAVYPRHETTANALLKRADQAMYRAKAHGKNTCIMAEG